MSEVRVRFAPSPTGNVHIGNLRVAIYNWLYARNKGGKFLIRVEDTDRERSTPEAVKNLFKALEWVGLDWDEEPTYQSQNKQRHLDVAQKLIDDGFAYRSDMGDASRGECVLFKINEDVEFTDEVLGTMKKSAEDMKDLVIVKSNGDPVFHLANVVDDIDMGITHVLRGNDHVENTFRHLLLYQALDKRPPVFAHLPMIVNGKGAPYSKRDGDAYVGDFKTKGYLPEVLFNFLVLCGWNPGDDREILSIDEMVNLFDTKRVQKKAAQFNMEKLEWMNNQYFQKKSTDEVMQILEPFYKDANLELRQFDKVWENFFWQNYKERAKTIPQLIESSRYLFEDFNEYDAKGWRKFMAKEGVAELLQDCIDVINSVEFDAQLLDKALNDLAVAKDIKYGKVAQPIRVAISGGPASPGLGETIVLVGKSRTIERINKAISKLNQN